MTDNRDSVSVPSWDGAARGWRRYTREVSWWVQATPIGKRRYCASKLISKLTGPARLLAMSWSVSKGTFDDPDGTRLLLQRLSASPLVRKTLPNAAAICQQYFSFKRSPQESIGNFLVRETLVHEEFVEAIIRLHEEKLGIAQDQRDFGLPDPVEEEVWAPWWDWMPEDEDTVTGETAEGDAAPTAGAPAARATTGSSPSHRGDGPAEVVEDKKPLVTDVAIDELSVADSFIMGVLRGWRLLQAAGLTAEEKRDILSTTKNSLDYDTVASALQSLWDEQLLGHRGHSGTTGFHLNHVNQEDHHDEEARVALALARDCSNATCSSIMYNQASQRTLRLLWGFIEMHHAFSQRESCKRKVKLHHRNVTRSLFECLHPIWHSTHRNAMLAPITVRQMRSLVKKTFLSGGFLR